MNNGNTGTQRPNHNQGGLLGSLGTLPAMELVAAAHSARTLSRLLIVLVAVAVISLIFTPWMQSVSGAGEVSALTPLERTQTISAVRPPSRRARAHGRYGRAPAVGRADP